MNTRATVLYVLNVPMQLLCPFHSFYLILFHSLHPSSLSVTVFLSRSHRWIPDMVWRFSAVKSFAHCFFAACCLRLLVYSPFSINFGAKLSQCLYVWCWYVQASKRTNEQNEWMSECTLYSLPLRTSHFFVFFFLCFTNILSYYLISLHHNIAFWSIRMNSTRWNYAKMPRMFVNFAMQHTTTLCFVGVGTICGLWMPLPML